MSQNQKEFDENFGKLTSELELKLFQFRASSLWVVKLPIKEGLTSDVLARGLVECDVLSVDDPSRVPGVPAASTSVRLPGVRLRLLAVMEQLYAEHVRLVARHVAGGDVEDDLALCVVLL